MKSKKTSTSKKRDRSEKSSKGESSKKKQKKNEKRADKEMPKAKSKSVRTVGGGRGQRKPRFTKPTSKKPRSKKTKKLVLVTGKQVKKWNKAATTAALDMGILQYHDREVFQHTCAVKLASHTSIDGMTLTNVRAPLGQLTYFRTQSGSTTPVTDLVDMRALANRSVAIRYTIASHCTFANNFAAPFWIDVYCLVPKGNQNVSPEDMITKGLADVNVFGDVTNHPVLTSVQAYPSMSPAFRDTWEIQSHKRVCLAPGEAVHLGFKKKNILADESNVEHENFTYMQQYGCHTYMTRLEGVVCHDSVNKTNVATSNASVDCIVDYSWKIRYGAGAKMTTNFLINGTASINNSAVVGWPSNSTNANPGG